MLGGQGQFWGATGQVWRRKLSDRPLATTVPALFDPDVDKDDLICSEILPTSTSSGALPNYSEALPLSRSVDCFRLRSERTSDSDEEEDLTGFEKEDREESLNNLLLLEEQQEGIRRYRSSVDDNHRVPQRKPRIREFDVPLMSDEEKPCPSLEAPEHESDCKVQEKGTLISHRLLCVLVMATVGLGLAALYRTNHQNSESVVQVAGRGQSVQPSSPNQRPGSFRLENLQNRNRLSFF